MNQEEQQDIFEDELYKLIDRFCDEFDLTYASCVGILEKVKFGIMIDMYSDEEDETQ